MAAPERDPSEAGLPAPGGMANLPDSIPLPPGERDHLLQREAFLLLVCAAFAATVYVLWSLAHAAWLADLPPEQQIPWRNLKDLAAPFLTAYAAARLHSGIVRRYDRQLQRHRMLLAHILDSSADGILTLDAEDRISTWNRGAEQIFGWTEAEILGRHASVLYPPGTEADTAADLEALRRAVEREGILRAHTAERVTRDGRLIRTEISATLLRDTQGRYAGRASIVRDVTERDRIRDALAERESLAAIGEMAAAVAHEIKNPLAGIGGAVKVIGRAFPEEDPRSEVVQEIQRQVRRLDETIRDLLTFARPTHPRFATLRLRELGERILRVLAEEPDLKPHRVTLEVPADIEVRADPQLMENILLNLLLNAGQALGPGPGHVVLRAEAAASRTVRISVRDDGPGIPEDILKRLFKPFFTTKTRGTGLGLTIVRKYVRVMGGRIEVQTRPGEGTIFTVVLPAPRQEAVPA